jgi:CDP-diacylglycerol---glycerol-3-phosphate 3-phosphatidyltransferase
LKNALRRKPALKVTILLDYFRGNRIDNENSSFSILAPLKDEFGARFNLSMYHSPNVGSLMRYFIPPRFIEVFGLQHMKGYLFDDDLIISGYANGFDLGPI